MNKGIQILGLVVIVFLAMGFKLFPESTTVSSSRGFFEQKGAYDSNYGKIPAGSILIRTSVQANDFLGSIFEKHQISIQLAMELSNLPDSIFNEKRIRTGNRYAVLYAMVDQKLIPQQFIYEKNKVDYIKVNVGEKLSYSIGHKPITYVDRITSGTITSSLYETMIANNANPLLAVELSEIYQWTIDFYHIQKNDHFKAIYTEQFVEGESLGAFKIDACVFKHFNDEKYAFLFNSDSTETFYNDYYDEDGLSLKRAFLKAPVKYSRISSVYQMNRKHPVTGKVKSHLGTDYAAPTGTPIYATADGTITHATYKKYNGNYVKVKHNSIYTTQYLHMSKIADGIKKGVHVAQGEIIGYVGSTGLATGPHVCYRFWKNGKQVDPSKQDLPQAKHIEEELMPQFIEHYKPLKEQLVATELLIL